jgi:pyruvate formate lyase activating enzyme
MNVFLPKIYGFNKASEIGVDVFAPSIFLKGCNLRCPYCMNSSLADGTADKEIDLEEVKKFIEEEKSEWLMISGGEPTCTPLFNLQVLIGEIKSWGCKIGMSTNGSNYRALSHIVEYLNYVALDIKASNIKDYEKISFIENVYEGVLDSRYSLRQNKKYRTNFDYEIRTTLFPPLINENSLAEIGYKIIDKNDKWILQQFRHSQNMLDPACKNIEPYSDERAKGLISIAKQFCNNVSLRYV